MKDLRNYAADEVLRDGGSIHVRAIRADDKQRLLDHFNLLSPRSVHFRFFGAKRRLTDEELTRFTELDFVRNAGLVATLRGDAGERIIGVGRYMSTAEHRAEVAFAVADEHQGRGIGTVLLEHLAAMARLNGISEFEADVLGENNQMLKVFRKSGFVAKRSIDSGVVHVSFPTEETDELIAASLDRDILASAESVRHFLQPQSIAVVGETEPATSMAGAVLANLRNGGFAGDIHVVDTAAQSTDTGAFATVEGIGRPVELAIIGVAAERVAAAVADCARAGVRAVVVLSAGFGDVSERGRVAEKELASLVRRSGMRLVGPNCLGVVNTDPAVRLYATFAGGRPPEGNVAMLVQSSGLSAAMLDYAGAHGLGLASFVSVGNKADVSGNDLLSYWMHEPRTKVIALYIENFGNPRRFARIAPRVARSKPIVALKSGRSRAAVNAERLGGGGDAAVDALFQQAGVIRTDTIEKLFDVLALLSSQPIPTGPRVGVVSNSGGPTMLVADAIEGGSLQLAALDPGTSAALTQALARDSGTTVNPLDLGASATPAEYEAAIRLLGADACVDALVAIHIPSLGTSDEDVAAAIARGAGEVPAQKPVLTVFIAARGAPATLHSGPRGRLPVYPFPENAALALAAAERYGRWQRRPVGRIFDLDRTAVSTIRAVVERVRGEGGPSPRLEARDFATVLRAAGIRYAESTQVPAADAAEIADTIGYPLVLKAVAPGLLHRSESGCVILGLTSKQSVASAMSDLRRRLENLGLRLDEVVLQREHPGGIEAIVDVVTDPLFGPLLVCGLGGVLVEVVRDRAARLPPVSDADAAEMIAGLRSARLLEGYRGVGPGDGAALEDLLVRVSALIDVVPEMSEMRLNPIKVLPPGMGVVVVDGHLRL